MMDGYGSYWGWWGSLDSASRFAAWQGVTAANGKPPQWLARINSATSTPTPLSIPTTWLTPGGGLHHIEEGQGDPGVQRAPQTLHAIEDGIGT